MTTTDDVYASKAFAYMQQGMKDREAFAIVMAVKGRGHDVWTSLERWAEEQLEQLEEDASRELARKAEIGNLHEGYADRTFMRYQEAISMLHVDLFHDDPTDIKERIDRFAEEAIELCQAFGMSRGDMHALIEYSFGREKGDPKQEVGGVITTLASLVLEAGFDFEALAVAGIKELRDKLPKIRAKRATRHGRGPLPGFDPERSPDITDDEATLGDKEAVHRVPRYEHNPPVPEPVSLHHEKTHVDAPVLDDSGISSAGFDPGPPLGGFTIEQIISALKYASTDQLRRELFDRGIMT